MVLSNNKAIKAARVASGLTQEQAAKIIQVSVPTYAARERLPKSFAVEELQELYENFNDQGKSIIASFIEEIFLSIRVT